MYKLLIVDDEEVEREGMAQFIPWSNYEIELVGTAWNGVEGFEKIQTLRPDIVLTDIKMPVMNGIELIKKTKQDFLETEFIVLSGYGEYEYTSQAMEEGVRHYILKPCDEEKIVEVLEKVKANIQKKLQQKKQTEQYDSTIRRLLPRAREEVFRNILLGREQIEADYQLFMDELEKENQQIRVLAICFEKKIDYLEQFVLENIMGELLGKERLILTTMLDSVYFLVRMVNVKELEQALVKAKDAFSRITDKPILAAISNEGNLENIQEMYLQTKELYRMGAAEHPGELLSYELFKEVQNEVSALVNYDVLRNAEEFGELLFEVYLMFCKMQLDGYTYEQKDEVCRWIGKVLYGESNIPKNKSERDAGTVEWQLLSDMVRFLYEEKCGENEADKEEIRFQTILLTIYQHLTMSEMNIRYLAKEILFMNEDYLGRVFLRYSKERFSPYVLKLRIELAKRIMQYRTDIKMLSVVELIGFPADGQYFSKAFRKITGMSPSEYREQLCRK